MEKQKLKHEQELTVISMKLCKTQPSFNKRISSSGNQTTSDGSHPTIYSYHHSRNASLSLVSHKSQLIQIRLLHSDQLIKKIKSWLNHEQSTIDGLCFNRRQWEVNQKPVPGCPSSEEVLQHSRRATWATFNTDSAQFNRWHFTFKKRSQVTPG